MKPHQKNATLGNTTRLQSLYDKEDVNVLKQSMKFIRMSYQFLDLETCLIIESLDTYNDYTSLSIIDYEFTPM